MIVKLQGIRATLQERLARLPEVLGDMDGLLGLWLFGSHARGEATPLSDLDFAYLGAVPDGGQTGSQLPTKGIEFPLRPGDAAATLDLALYRRLSHHFETDDLTLINLDGAPAGLVLEILTKGQRFLGRPGVEERRMALLERCLTAFPEIHRLAVQARGGHRDLLRGGRVEIDREKILDQLRLLQEDLDGLRSTAALSLKAYLENRDRQLALERRLQTAVEACVNIGNHLIARRGLEVARSYAGVFESLAKGELIGRDLAVAFEDLARLRDLLVHRYWDLDQQRLKEQLPTRIEVLDDFKAQMVKSLDLWPLTVTS